MKIQFSLKFIYICKSHSKKQRGSDVMKHSANTDHTHDKTH